MSDLEGRLAATLKGVSERHLDEAPRRPGAAQREVIQRVRRRWGALVMTATAVTALALTAVAVSVPQLVSERTEFPSGSAPTQLVPVTTTIPTGGNPVAIAADDQAVWVALGNGSVQRTGSDTTSTIEVAPSLTDVAVGAGQVWATGELRPQLVSGSGEEYALYRLLPSDTSPETDLVLHRMSHEQQRLAVTAESLWSISSQANPEAGTLNRFTLSANDFQLAGDGEPETTEWRPEGVVADGDSLWTVGTDGGAVIRELDGVTGEVRRRFIGGGASTIQCYSCRPPTSPIAVGNGYVAGLWQGSEVVALVDESRDEVRLSDAAGQLGGTRAVAISQGAAWVVIANDRVARIDLETGELIGEPVEVGPDPVDIAAGAGAVWTINRGDGTVTRIDLVEPDPAPVERATPDDEASPDVDPSPAPSPAPPTPSPSPTPAPDNLSDGLDVDAQMGELIDALGASCQNFDFQSMEEIGGYSYRPAYCDDGGEEETILLFSFATEEDRQAWVDGGRDSEFSLKRRNYIVAGPTWEAHVIDTDLAVSVGHKLDGTTMGQGGKGVKGLPPPPDKGQD